MCVIYLCAVWLLSSEGIKNYYSKWSPILTEKSSTLFFIFKAKAFSEIRLNSFKYNKYKLLLVVKNAMRKRYDLTLHEAVLPKTFFCAEQRNSNRNSRIFSMAYTLQSWSECKHTNSPPWQFYLGYRQTEIFLGNFQM